MDARHIDVERWVDNFNQHKKARFKKFMIAFGAFIIPFVLITSLVLPIYDDRRGIDILLSYLGGDGDVIVVGDNSSEPEAYNYWYAPENSFGISETKTVNWSHFKSLFLAHTDWMLEYKRYDYSEWTDGSDYLTIERTWNDTGFWKFNLIFDVPVDVYSARFTFGIDLPALQYVERDGYEVWINYTANSTETYSCMFNWSDIASTPNLVITKGVQDGMFWFRFRRDDIPVGYYEFDPAFGNTNIENTTGITVENVIGGGLFTMGATGGTADNITARIRNAVASNTKCALYDSSSNLLANGVTEQKSIGTSNAYAWVTFNFTGTKPSLTASTNYYIVVWSATQLGTMSLGQEITIGTDNTYTDSEAYNGFPASATFVLGTSDRTACIYCNYTEGVANAAPTQTGEIPTNHSTEISITPQLNVTVDDADDDGLNVTWLSNSSGSWVWFARNSSIDGATLPLSIVQTNSNFTAYSTKYWWSVNATDGTDWKNVTYDFTTGNDTVKITLLSYSPANIRTNSSEPSWFIYNITTGGTAINNWSIVWAYGVNHTEISSHNTSYSLEDPLAVDKLRGYSRNENNTQETKFNSTAGDGSIGDFGEWNTHDMNGGMITVDASGTNWTRVNSTEEETEHLFAHITFVDEEEIREEQKSGQEIDVTIANFVKVEFNMTDTDWWDSSHYNNTLYKFHFFANETSANKPLSVYYVNDSYTTGDVASSPYAALIGAIQPDDPYHISEDNSSYYEIVFSSTDAGFVGAVNMTEKFYIIFTGRGAAPKRWWIHYADNNDSHVVDGDTHYHDFDNRTIIEVSGNGGNSWTANASTPDVYLDFISLNEEDKVEVKLYANDTSGNEAWSSTHQDLVDITNYPPNTPGVVIPNDEPPTDLYEVGEIINITYNWIGDPNHETCWVNITAHTGTTEDVAYYIQNRSITDAETHVNATWWYDWYTTGISTGTYHINITATDPFNEQAWGEQNGTFDLIAWQDVNTTVNGSFTNVSIRAWQVVNNTVNGAFTNATTWQNVNTTVNGAFTNTTLWQNVDTTYNGAFTNTTTWHNVDVDYNGEFTNVSTKTWQNVNDTVNGAFTNTTTWHDVDTTYNGAFTNTTTWQNVDTSINGAFTNTTIWYNVDIAYNGEFTNISIRTWQNVNTTINGEFTNVSIKTWQNVDTTYNGAFTNVTTWQDVDTSINGEFTNVSVVSNITITNPSPANGSIDIPVNTSLHFTVTHALGHLMNITVYTGSNLTNCSAYLGSFNSVVNGTYYLGYHNASEVSTEYAWRVNVTDAYDNYAQETYNFTTASTTAEIYAMSNPTGYGMGMVMAFSMAFGILFLVVGMLLFRRKRKKNEY